MILYFISDRTMKMERAQSMCESTRPKRSDPAPIDEFEHEPQLYRSLLSIFTDNINKLLKMHRSCILETEAYPKIKVTREEQQATEETKEVVYARYEEKMSRDAHARNAAIKRNYADFMKEYHLAFPHTDCASNTVTVQTNPQEEVSQSNKLDLNKTLSRPNLSTRSASPNPRNTQRNRAPTAMHQHNPMHSPQIYKLKNITAHAGEVPANHRCFMTTNRNLTKDHRSAFNRTFFQSNRKAENEMEQQKKGKGMIYKELESEELANNSLLKNGYTSNSTVLTPCSTYTKACAKRLITLKFTHKRSMQAKPSLHMNDHVMLVNSVLSINPPAGQGYRAKSRCWQNYFN